MENQQIVYTEENNKTSFLASHENSTAAILLIEKACEQYQNTFNKLNVPFDYIEFFCEEFNKYSGLFTNKLKDFHDGFVKYSVTPEDLIEIYATSHFSQHSEIKVTKNTKYLCFKHPVVLTFTKEMRQVKNLNISTLVENIVNICYKLSKQDELLSLVDLYEQFMIRKFLADYKFKKLNTDTQIESKSGSQEDDNNMLVGNSIDDIYQSEGKITRIVIPKLKLPSAYATDQENSRVLANRRVFHFCSPAKEIVFINRKKIVAVKYTTDFIERRQEKKKKKFDWDF